MKRRSGGRAPGQIRQSQLLTTFGPGSLLDLPTKSALVGGLDHWLQRGEEVHEPRLVDKLKRCFDPPLERLQLFAPPPDHQDPTLPKTGITAWQFPEWFITQDVEDTDRGAPAIRSRLLVHRIGLRHGKFIDRDKRRRPVVPVRFVRACRRGHIGDIDWHAFVHVGAPPHRLQLYIDERGTSGDLSEVWVRCECGVERPMSDAAKIDRQSLGHCDGSRPWLGPFTKEKCGEPSRLLVRTASNAYFPQILSVISLPEKDEGLTQAVNQVWEHYLANVDSVDDLQYLRKKMPAVKAALEKYTDDEIIQQVLTRKTDGFFAPAKSVKQAELETLVGCKDEIGSNRPEGDFYARVLPKSAWDKPWMEAVEKIVLVHRLREVMAQVGFTRFESSTPDMEGELEMGVQAATLAREVSWLPAVENRGEGVFIQFKKDAIDEWYEKAAVKKRARQLLKGFESWQCEHSQSKRSFPGAQYIILHSLSHLLITAMSLECGYPASSIRERVYAGSSGCGILLYTGSPDAEGTLGGLVEAGRRIAQHMKEALERGGLCSNDPVCAQHEPHNAHECRFLLGAACHGCLLIAETSCEQKNDFLDRALVVPTVDNLGAEFFKLGGGMIPAIESLGEADLHEIAVALRSGRLAPPFTVAALQRFCSGQNEKLVATEMQSLADDGLKPGHLALMLDSLATARSHCPEVRDPVDLVWTGPEAPGIANRDTSVVVRELFANATECVLVAGYAVYQGREVFRALAERMAQLPALKVRMFLDVQRRHRDTTKDTELVREFAHRFRTAEWPGSRLPEVYYDPRSLELDNTKRSSMHAKCIVIDRKLALVTSANFTEAAQTRNIEVGALVRSEQFAAQLVRHFETLADGGLLRPLFFESSRSDS